MVSKDLIVELRHKTGAGMMDCKEALTESKGDVEKAVEVLRKKGIQVAQKKSSRTTKDGAVVSYIHPGSKIGVMVEVLCETDFVAKTDEFKNFGKEVAMQIAAQRPLYLKKEDVPADVLEKERHIMLAILADKPKNVADKIVEGKLDKFYKEFCLLEQPFIKDDKVAIKDLLTQVIAKTGEKIEIKKFVRYQLGEE